MGSGSAVHRMPASSSAFRPPESWPPPASCCRRESAAALPRNKQRRARVRPETLPSSPPEMLQLIYGLECYPKLLGHDTLALAFHQHDPPNTCIDLHDEIGR